jgi:hypothetical protein
MRKRTLIPVVLLATGLSFGFYLFHALNDLAYMRFGMTSIRTPSGQTLYLRRQSVRDRLSALFLSKKDDYCAPFDRRHDVLLADSGPDTGVLFYSFADDAIVVHSERKPRLSWFSSNAATVSYEAVSQTEVESVANGNSPLPSGWQRAEVTYGNNTCSL